MAKSKNVWTDLYVAAVALRDANPWKSLTARDLFGISNPVDGEIYYCAVAESADKTFKGLTAYQGAAGLEFYQRIGRDDVDMLHMLWAQQGFQIQYGSRDELTEESYKRIKESGISCRGKQSWPMFTAFSSGRAETELTEDHAEVLILILEQSLAMLEAVKKDKKKEVLGNPEEDFRFPVRQKKASKWQIAYLTPDAVAAPKALSWTKKDQEKLAGKEIGNISWDLDGFYWPSLPQETAEGIRLPFIWAIADREKGTLLSLDTTYAKDSWKEGKSFLLEQFGSSETLPSRIAVKRPELLLWLEPVLKAMNIQLLLVQEVPGMIKAREELRKQEATLS